jgi:ribonucleoside-diphosphate reductase alpha chain
MRNSNCVAIAPTATIANIVGVSPCIEPTYRNLYVKSNLSGEFTVVNDYLVRDLKERNLWDEVMVADLKYFDGSLERIDRIPADLRALYATAFEVDPRWIVECASRRQKWIDQAQSLNIFMRGVSGKKLDDTYKLAWVRGLKTTYYLRSSSATNAEKSTGRGGELNAVSMNQNTGSSAAAAAAALPEPEVLGTVCTLRPGDEGFEDCEACP